jgi:hypothetical protein
MRLTSNHVVPGTTWFALAALVGVLLWTSAAEARSPSSAAIENSLTVFPTMIDVEARRGEVVERTVGIVQSGADLRDVTFEITGAAGPHITIHDAVSGERVEHVDATEGAPTFVVVRFAPTAPLPDGPLAASVEVVAQDDEVAIGSVVELRLDVSGDHVVRADLTELSTNGTVEIGRPFRISATLDVDGTALLEPDIALILDSATATEDLRAHPPPVEPGAGRVVEVSWATGSWAPGRYTGDVILGAQGVEIARAPVTVDVVPAGTAPRAVEVLGVEILERSGAGGLTKLGIQVRNSGAFEGRAVFVGDLWRESTVVAPLRSDPRMVPPNDVAELVIYARTDEDGLHRLRGRANLDGADSSEFAFEFEVDGSSDRVRWYLGALALATLAGGSIAWRRRHS